MAEPLHAGHRERLRKRFLEEGLDGFEDHQLLELLLFHVIPRKDTNPIAHQLLKGFNGSLKAVFEAHPKDLQDVGGIGESAAAFLHLIAGVTRRYYKESLRLGTQRLDTTEKVADYIGPFMVGHAEELFYVICLDRQLRLKAPVLVSKGVVDGIIVNPRQVVEAVVRTRASNVVLAHNHPSGSLKPSREDVETTNVLTTVLSGIGVPVLDHLIIAGEEWFSFRREGRLPAALKARRRISEEPSPEFT